MSSIGHAKTECLMVVCGVVLSYLPQYVPNEMSCRIPPSSTTPCAEVHLLLLHPPPGGFAPFLPHPHVLQPAVLPRPDLLPHPCLP